MLGRSGLLVQPGRLDRWRSPPFEPTLRENLKMMLVEKMKVYDEKLAALAATQEEQGKVQVKQAATQEEQGTKIEAILEALKLRIAVALAQAHLVCSTAVRRGGIAVEERIVMEGDRLPFKGTSPLVVEFEGGSQIDDVGKRQVVAKSLRNRCEPFRNPRLP